MLKIFINVCILLLACYSTAAQDVKAEFEKALADKSVAIETIMCDFTQVRSMAVLTQEVSKEGKFTYVRPGNILLAFDDGDYIKLTESDFTMRNAGNVMDVKVTSNPMLRELKKILSACMTGDLKSMASGFSINVIDLQDFYEVTLLPVKGRGAAKMKSVKMNFDKQDMSLIMLMLEEPSGDSIRYEFTDKEFNKEVPAGTFHK